MRMTMGISGVGRISVSPLLTISSTCSTSLAFSPCSIRSTTNPNRPPKAKAKARITRRLTTTIRAARTESKGVSLGLRAPDFQLAEPLTGKTWKLDDFESHPALLVMFICNHCPFVKHLKKDIVELTNFYMKKGLAVVAISSNSVVTHPQDGPEFMAEEAKVLGYAFPYLYDESQVVARAFGAVCTPEFFLFKKDGRRPFELVYHGQFDDSRPSNNMRITGRDLSVAIDCVLSCQPLTLAQKPSGTLNRSPSLQSLVRWFQFQGSLFARQQEHVIKASFGDSIKD